MLGAYHSIRSSVCSVDGTEVLGHKRPYYKVKAEAGILLLISKGSIPEKADHPEITEIAEGEDIWTLLVRCWAFKPADRPAMADVSTKASSRGPPMIKMLTTNLQLLELGF